MSSQNQRFTPVLANRIDGLGIALANVAGNQQEVAGTSRIADDFKSNIARADITPAEPMDETHRSFRRRPQAIPRRPCRVHRRILP
jgi:hypothetical protein